MYSMCSNGYQNGRIQANIPVLIEVHIIYHTISEVYKLRISIQYLYISYGFIPLVKGIRVTAYKISIYSHLFVYSPIFLTSQSDSAVEL